VAGILLSKYSPWFAGITFVTLIFYIGFTLFVTEWRMVVRRTMNDLDSKANSRAIDSLLNYETVKYFGNEEYEARRYDHNMEHWESAAVRNQTSPCFSERRTECHYRHWHHGADVAGGRRGCQRHDDRG